MTFEELQDLLAEQFLDGDDLGAAQAAAQRWLTWAPTMRI